MAGRESKPYAIKDDEGRVIRWKQALTIPGRVPPRQYVSAKTEREVRAKVKEIKARLAQGLPARPGKRTLGQYLESWLEDTASLRVRPHTLHNYRSRLRHVQVKIGHIRLEDVRPEDIRRCYRQLEKDDLKPRTVEAIHRVLKTALKDALLDRQLLWNPMAAVKAPQYEQSKRQLLSLADAVRLIDHTADDGLGALWHLLLVTGLRVGEAAALYWSDLDLEGKRLTVSQTLHRVPGGASAGAIPRPSPAGGPSTWKTTYWPRSRRTGGGRSRHGSRPPSGAIRSSSSAASAANSWALPRGELRSTEHFAS